MYTPHITCITPSPIHHTNTSLYVHIHPLFLKHHSIYIYISLDHASLPVPLPHTIWYDDLTICPPFFPSPTHLHRYTLINLHGHPTFAHTPSLTHSLTHTHTPPIHTNNYTPCYPRSLCRKTKPVLTRCHAPLYYVIVFNTSQFPYNQFLSLYKQRTQKNHTAFVCKERSKTNNSNCKSPPCLDF